jgi:hypothetical protein
MPDKQRLEPVELLLMGGIVFFTICLFISERFFPSDGQIFQVVSGLLTGFGGAFLMRVKPKGDKADVPMVPPPGGKVEMLSVTNPDPPK